MGIEWIIVLLVALFAGWLAGSRWLALKSGDRERDTGSTRRVTASARRQAWRVFRWWNRRDRE